MGIVFPSLLNPAAELGPPSTLGFTVADEPLQVKGRGHPLGDQTFRLASNGPDSRGATAQARRMARFGFSLAIQDAQSRLGTTCPEPTPRRLPSAKRRTAMGPSLGTLCDRRRTRR
jgi:hypothetical protein